MGIYLQVGEHGSGEIAFGYWQDEKLAHNGEANVGYECVMGNICYNIGCVVECGGVGGEGNWRPLSMS